MPYVPVCPFVYTKVDYTHACSRLSVVRLRVLPWNPCVGIESRASTADMSLLLPTVLSLAHLSNRG